MSYEHKEEVNRSGTLLTHTTHHLGRHWVWCEVVLTTTHPSAGEINHMVTPKADQIPACLILGLCSYWRYPQPRQAATHIPVARVRPRWFASIVPVRETLTRSSHYGRFLAQLAGIARGKRGWRTQGPLTEHLAQHTVSVSEGKHSFSSPQQVTFSSSFALLKRSCNRLHVMELVGKFCTLSLGLKIMRTC